MTRPVLIVGAPRSGTSWVFRVLGRAQDTVRIYEPDNEMLHPQALRAKRGLGRFPVLAAGDESRALATLWDRTLTGRVPSASRFQRKAASVFEKAPPGERRSAVDGGPVSRHLRNAMLLASLPDRTSAKAGVVPVAKSVHSAFCLPWLAARWDPRVVVVLRDPRNVIASWLELDIGDRDRRLDDNPLIRSSVIEPLGLPASPSSEDPIRRIAWTLGLLNSAVLAVAAAHPDWVLTNHEALCVDPHAAFRALVEEAGLTWTEACDRYLDNANAEGEGFTVKRVAAEQPERWRARLSPAQAQEIADEMARFPDLRADPLNARSEGRS